MKYLLVWKNFFHTCVCRHRRHGYSTAKRDFDAKKRMKPKVEMQNQH